MPKTGFFQQNKEIPAFGMPEAAAVSDCSPSMRRELEGRIHTLTRENEKLEAALLSRLYRYETNYFSWVKDFSLPVTNNLSERSLRGIKSKQKISGQFWNTENAGYYAKIQSYMETCRRNGISPHHAMVRLMNGNPYSVDELLGLSGA